MLLILLLLIPLAGSFIISTTVSHDNSYSNLKQIKLTGLVTSLINLFVSLIASIFLICFNLFKSLLDLKTVLATKANIYCIIFGLCYIVLNMINSLVLSTQIDIFLLILSMINSLELSTQIVIYILIPSSLTLIYLVYFASSIYNKYPKFYYFLLGLFVVIVLICVIVLILKLCLGIDAIHWLFSKFGFLKDFWVWIKSTKPNQTNTEGNKPNSNQNSPNDNSDSTLTPEEIKRRKKREYAAKRRRDNPEKVKASNKKSYDKNKAKNNEKDRNRYKNNEERHNYAKNYRQNHLEQSRANDRKNYQEHPEATRARNRKYHSENKETLNLKRKTRAEQERNDMAQYEGINLENKALYDSWLALSEKELKSQLKQHNKDIQRGFEFYKANPNYYDDLNMDID